MVTSTGKIMKIFDQWENNPVHLHELNQSHESVFEFIIPILAVEDFNKSIHNNNNLNIGQSILRKLVFMFKVGTFFKENARKRKQIDDDA